MTDLSGIKEAFYGAVCLSAEYTQKSPELYVADGHSAQVRQGGRASVPERSGAPVIDRCETELRIRRPCGLHKAGPS